MSTYYNINAEVHQGRVASYQYSIIYSPTKKTTNTIPTTYAEDTEILLSKNDLLIATQLAQHHLNLISWIKQ